MPLVNINRAIIMVPLADRVFAGTIIKQTATFVTLSHVQDPNSGVCSAVIVVLVKYYANNAGALGMSLNDHGVPDKQFNLTADNNTIVDASTGAILAINPVFFESPEWLAQVAAFTQNVMKQGDFFQAMRDASPIIIGDLIKHHIAQADSMGRFV